MIDSAVTPLSVSQKFIFHLDRPKASHKNETNLSMSSSVPICSILFFHFVQCNHASCLRIKLWAQLNCPFSSDSGSHRMTQGFL